MCQTFLSKPFTNLLTMQKQYEKNVWEKTNDTVILIVDKSTDHDKPHFDSFYITISMLKKLFLSAEKGIARHIDTSSVLWTLIDNGKLANQIARLAAIVVYTFLITVAMKLSRTSNFIGSC